MNNRQSNLYNPKFVMEEMLWPHSKLPIVYKGEKIVFRKYLLPEEASQQVIYTPPVGKKTFIIGTPGSDASGGSGTGTIRIQVLKANGDIFDHRSTTSAPANGFYTFDTVVVIEQGDSIIASTLNQASIWMYLLEMDQDVPLFTVWKQINTTLTKVHEVPQGKIHAVVGSFSPAYGSFGYQNLFKVYNGTGTARVITSYLTHVAGEDPLTRLLNSQSVNHNIIHQPAASFNHLRYGNELWISSNSNLTPQHFQITYYELPDTYR